MFFQIMDKFPRDSSCHLCGKRFTRRHDRDRHVREVHKKIPRTDACPACRPERSSVSTRRVVGDILVEIKSSQVHDPYLMLSQEGTDASLCLSPADWAKLKRLFEIASNLSQLQIRANIEVNEEVSLFFGKCREQYYVEVRTYVNGSVFAPENSLRFTMGEWNDFVNYSDWIEENISLHYDTQ